MPGLVRDNAGNLVLPGRTTHRVVGPDLLTSSPSLPSWLTVNSGTASYVNVTATTGRPYMQVATGSTIGNQAQVYSAFQVGEPSAYAAIKIGIQSLALPDDTTPNFDFHMHIGDTGLVRGVAMFQNAADDNATLRGYTDGSTFQDTDLPGVRVLGAKNERRAQNLALLWLPADGMAYILQDDQVIGAGPVDEATDDPQMRLIVTMTTQQASAQNLRFAQIEFELRHW